MKISQPITATPGLINGSVIVVLNTVRGLIHLTPMEARRLADEIINAVGRCCDDGYTFHAESARLSDLTPQANATNIVTDRRCPCCQGAVDY